MQIFFKGIGCVLLLMSGTAVGFQTGERLMIRVKMLMEMLSVLQYLQTNLKYRRDTTCDALRNMTQLCTLENLPFHLGILTPQTLPTVLAEALCKLQKSVKSILKPPEIDLFCTALTEFGSAGAEEESKKLVYAQTALKEICDKAKEDAAKDRKLYRAIGIAGGVAAALLFV
ncbi:MAG: stage III sporulation protein AB [Ruthenibacterium sp.]